jgi:DNA-binding CsgD family transcriptional regulator
VDAFAFIDRELAKSWRAHRNIESLYFAWMKSWLAWRDGRPFTRDLAFAIETMVAVPTGGGPWGAHARAIHAEFMLAGGDVPAAIRIADDAVRIAYGSPSRMWARPAVDRTAARVALVDGDVSKAEERGHLALAAAVDMGMQWVTAEVLETLAAVAAAIDSPAEAARLLGGGAALRARIGWVPGVPEEAELRQLAATLVDAIGQDDFTSAYAEGEAMSQDDVVAYAGRGRGARKRPSFGWSSLTPTEADVVRLVADGLRNKDIAEKLFMSPATVKTHLTHVYAKLGLTNRTELAAQAAQRP